MSEKRRPGRPRKNPIPGSEVKAAGRKKTTTGSEMEAAGKRRPGRPRKTLNTGLGLGVAGRRSQRLSSRPSINFAEDEDDEFASEDHTTDQNVSPVKNDSPDKNWAMDMEASPPSDEYQSDRSESSDIIDGEEIDATPVTVTPVKQRRRAKNKQSYYSPVTPFNLGGRAKNEEIYDNLGTPFTLGRRAKEEIDDSPITSLTQRRRAKEEFDDSPGTPFTLRRRAKEEFDDSPVTPFTLRSRAKVIKFPSLGVKVRADWTWICPCASIMNSAPRRVSKRVLRNSRAHELATSATIAPRTPPRKAATEARERVRAMNASPPPVAAKPISPRLMEAAATFEQRKNVKLQPIPLGRYRLTIDGFNVALYAEEGATDLWASALSSSRFNGPRRSAPFRELHRLSDPDDHDFSDWAENIRWAKEQHRLYGSVWTEWDYSLEMITEHRRKVPWISELMINGAKFPKSSY